MAVARKVVMALSSAAMESSRKAFDGDGGEGGVYNVVLQDCVDGSGEEGGYGVVKCGDVVIREGVDGKDGREADKKAVARKAAMVPSSAAM